MKEKLLFIGLFVNFFLYKMLCIHIDTYFCVQLNAYYPIISMT